MIEYERDQVAPEQTLDPRVWLLWLGAAMLPPLLSRNPFPLLAVMLAVVYVRAAWSASPNRLGGRGFAALLLVIVTFSTVLNGLTAPFGEQIIVTLPGWWPGTGVLTLNALVYGLLTGLAIVSIVLAATTAAALIDWPATLRLLPHQFLTLAVAASVAWSFIPQTVLTLRDIRDAQWARGVAPRSGRAVLPLVMPLLTTSLDRATTMAEALESRGFGGENRGKRHSSMRPAVLLVSGLTLAVLAVYLYFDGMRWSALVCAGLSLSAIGFALRGRAPDHRSRYRRRHWQARDMVVAMLAAGSLATTVAVAITDRAALRYDPYPTLAAPHASLLLIAGCGLLLAPVPLAPRRPAAQPIARWALAGALSSVTADGALLSRSISPSAPGEHRIRHVEPSFRRGRRPWATWPPRHSGARRRRADRRRGSVAGV